MSKVVASQPLRFSEDIVVAGDDGTLYHITQKDLKQFEVSQEEAESLTFSVVRSQLYNGAVAAAMPTRVAVDVDTGEEALWAACYLLNLASLRRRTLYEDGINIEEDSEIE